MKMGNKSYFTYKRAEQEEILKKIEENYIKELLGENLISLEYKKHERYTRYDCVILVKREVAPSIS